MGRWVGVDQEVEPTSFSNSATLEFGEEGAVLFFVSLAGLVFELGVVRPSLLELEESLRRCI